MGSPAGGMTLPQVISLLDKRLINMETMMKTVAEKQQDHEGRLSGNITLGQAAQGGENQIPSMEVLGDIQERFEMMADEIANLKNIVMSLQSYTMDVNRMLLDQLKLVSTETATEEEVEEGAEVTTDASLDSAAAPITSYSNLLQGMSLSGNDIMGVSLNSLDIGGIEEINPSRVSWST